jgi:crossover junction endodeoxyribonuclease RuvC
MLLAIDPGLHGGLAVLDQDGRLLLCEDLPAVGTGASVRVDAAELGRLLRPYLADLKLAVIEQAAAMPKQGVASTFRYGRAVGAIEGALGALAVPLELVPPSRWKRDLGVSSKEESRAMAARLWPSVSFAKVKDEHRAEAALIARWRLTR